MGAGADRSSDQMEEMMNSSSGTSRLQAAIHFTRDLAWALFLVCLPVTSFPFFPPVLGGGALVRPLSFYPLIVLLVLFTFPYMFKKPLPKTLLTILPFILIALVSCLFSTLRDIDPFMEISATDRILRALITLAIGVAIYYTVSLYPCSWQHLRFSLRWLYAGFGIALLWGTLQAVYVVKYIHSYFQVLSRLQRFISMRKLFTTRISGMTYEPNWFAEQISVLLLPWLLASVLTGYSVFRWRWRWLTVEWILLGWSVVILVFTYSRAGLINLIALLLLALLFFRMQHRQRASIWMSWPVRFAEAGIVLAVLAGMFYFAGARNSFFARIWDYWRYTKVTSISDYFEYLGFGARFSYGGAAFRTYEAYPMLGVGLGNYAFYFNQMLPDRPLAVMPEVMRIVTPDTARNRLITAKVLYLRLLAETGLVGLAGFLSFVVAVLGAAIYLWLSSHRDEKFWGTAAILGMIVVILSAFSFDSFAIPNMWVVLGFITAATRVARENPPILPEKDIIKSSTGQFDAVSFV